MTQLLENKKTQNSNEQITCKFCYNEGHDLNNCQILGLELTRTNKPWPVGANNFWRSSAYRVYRPGQNRFDNRLRHNGFINESNFINRPNFQRNFGNNNYDNRRFNTQNRNRYANFRNFDNPARFNNYNQRWNPNYYDNRNNYHLENRYNDFNRENRRNFNFNENNLQNSYGNSPNEDKQNYLNYQRRSPQESPGNLRPLSNINRN